MLIFDYGYILQEYKKRISLTKRNIEGNKNNTVVTLWKNRVKENGASCVELQSVSDKKHEKYYGKAGYKIAVNFVTICLLQISM